jgi:phosphate:Na+ symporter
MDVDIFKEVLVPAIGGLGIFMLGLEFMANGIQALAVNKMRAVSSGNIFLHPVGRW